jgi:hypothetical protein
LRACAFAFLLGAAHAAHLRWLLALFVFALLAPCRGPSSPTGLLFAAGFSPLPPSLFEVR